jgi:hypothetical protein
MKQPEGHEQHLLVKLHESSFVLYEFGSSWNIIDDTHVPGEVEVGLRKESAQPIVLRHNLLHI